MGAAQEDFLRLYATSPIHVTRLERLLIVYGNDDEERDAFARRFIGWDRECPHPEAARVVSEILATCTDRSGKILRLSDDVVENSIRWMAEETSLPLAERAVRLRDALALPDAPRRSR
jgi:hypothetical protein